MYICIAGFPDSVFDETNPRKNETTQIVDPVHTDIYRGFSSDLLLRRNRGTPQKGDGCA